MIRPRLQFHLFIALAALLVLVGCVNSRDLRPGRTTLPKKPLVIPAQLVGNLFIVEAKWDKHGPWRFMVDTGSAVTLVSAEFAKRYATDKAALGAPAVRVKGTDSNATLLPAVTLRSIELDDARFENVQALIYNFDELSAHLGIKIDGVLSFPLFRETVFTLDYPQSRLVLKPAWPAPMPTPELGTTIKFYDSQRTPFIPVRLGAENIIALIDSGNDGPFMLNPLGLHMRFIQGPRPGVDVGTVAGSRTQQLGRVEQPLDIGPFRFEQPIVEISDQMTAISGSILKNFSVTFDQSRNQVSFYRASAAPIPPTPRRTVGISFSKTPAYWRVAGIVAASPAETAGVKAGDLVTRINGESIADWNYTRYDALVRRAEEITFTFLQGTKEVPVVIPTFILVP